MLSESTRKMLEKKLQFVDGKITNKEDNIRGGLYMLSVGIVGMGIGVLNKSDSQLFSGLLVSYGSLIFRLVNKQRLMKYEYERDALKAILKNPEKVIKMKYDKKSNDGKHFKK